MPRKKYTRPEANTKMTDMDKVVASNLAALMADRSVTDAHLAEAMGCAEQMAAKYRRGESRVSASRLYDLAKFFTVPVDTFYKGVAR